MHENDCLRDNKKHTSTFSEQTLYGAQRKFKNVLLCVMCMALIRMFFYFIPAANKNKTISFLDYE